MIEFPEALSLAHQITEEMRGKQIVGVIAGAFPHAFARFHGGPSNHAELLLGTRIAGATSHGGYVEIALDDAFLVFAEGVNLRRHRAVRSGLARTSCWSSSTTGPRWPHPYTGRGRRRVSGMPASMTPSRPPRPSAGRACPQRDRRPG